jgi:hypothetical protein
MRSHGRIRLLFFCFEWATPERPSQIKSMFKAGSSHQPPGLAGVFTFFMGFGALPHVDWAVIGVGRPRPHGRPQAGGFGRVSRGRSSLFGRGREGPSPMSKGALGSPQGQRGATIVN